MPVRDPRRDDDPWAWLDEGRRRPGPWTVAFWTLAVIFAALLAYATFGMPVR